jgi:hypothetical protein
VRLLAALIAALIVVGACGRVSFDPLGPRDADNAGEAADASRLGVGLRLWLEMETDPGTGPIIDSAANHAVACNGACPTIVAGVRGKAYQFASEQLVVTYRNDLDTTNSFSAAIWMRLDNYAAPCCSCGFAKPVGTADYDTFAMCVDSASHTTYINTDMITGFQGLAGPVMPLGEWHHVTLSWDKVTKRLYFDGSLQASTSPITFASDGNDIRIGADNGNAMAADFHWSGALDDVRFYDRALSPDEVAQLAAP